MGSLKRILVATAAALAATTAAKAADLPDPIIPAPQIIEDFGGWYLRGDIGVDFFRNPKVTYNNVLRFSHEKLQPTVMIGAGAGYVWNKWLRTDVTFDYRRTDFNGKTPCTTPCGNVGFNQENAELGIFTGMANAYLEAGNFHGFTPYIGAGIGFAHVRLHEFFAINGGGTAPNSFNDRNQTNFAWMATAGTSYDVWDNLALDANYRYIDFGSVRTGADPTAALPGNVKFDKIAAHELRVGLRYYLD